MHMQAIRHVDTRTRGDVLYEEECRLKRMRFPGRHWHTIDLDSWAKSILSWDPHVDYRHHLQTMLVHLQVLKSPQLVK